MAEANQELMLEVLRQIQSDVAMMRKDIQALKQGQVDIRGENSILAGRFTY